MDGLLWLFLIIAAFAAIPIFIGFTAVTLTERDQAKQLLRDSPSTVPSATNSTAEAKRIYIPNQIPLKTRVWNVTLSLALLTYGSIGLHINDIYIPGKRGGIHLHSVAAWIVYAAMLCACANLTSVVVDHYDRRNNEKRYLSFAKLTQYSGWILFIGALTIGLFFKQLITK